MFDFQEGIIGNFPWETDLSAQNLISAPIMRGFYAVNSLSDYPQTATALSHPVPATMAFCHEQVSWIH